MLLLNWQEVGRGSLRGRGFAGNVKARNLVAFQAQHNVKNETLRLQKWGGVTAVAIIKFSQPVKASQMC